MSNEITRMCIEEMTGSRKRGLGDEGFFGGGRPG